MGDQSLPTTFHLIRQDELLAVLDACRPAEEMFWLVCMFQPKEAFALVESLFHKASQTDDDDLFNEIYEQLQAMGVELINVRDDEAIKDFVLHIDGDTVTLRYA
jgi:hypothetical protein